MNIKHLSSLAAALLLTLPASFAQTPAFPGAEGYGMFTTGGRGGKVFHVTNLNDSGEGSLRWALAQNGTKTIVFDVSGTIHLESALDISQGSVTIAGQTAPGDGICLADYPVSIQANNVIVRYMRFRLGNKNVKKDGADGWDGFGGFDQQDIIIDHCSVSWSIDECLSVLGNKNTTVQWCLVAQSLVNSGHSKGAHGYGGNWGGTYASFHHNLIAHHTSRTPRLGPRPTTQLNERMDMRNNVIYNWGSNGCYGGEGMNVNIVNNYYKPGPGTPTNDKGKRITSIGVRTNEYIEKYPDYAPALHLWGTYYVAGNVNSVYSDVTANNWNYGIYNQISDDNDGTYNASVKEQIRLSDPIPFCMTTTHSANVAYERVLSYVGASLHRDSFDDQIIADTRDGKASATGSGLSAGFINTQDDNKPADADESWSAWPSLTTDNSIDVTDSDGDGMPDSYESANGLNPSDPSDGNSLNAEGYTNLEVYLNSLVEDITSAQNADGELLGLSEKIKDDTPVMLSAQTYSTNGENTSEWLFSDGFSISNSDGKAFAKAGSYLKLSKSVIFNIGMPEGYAVKKVSISGYSNADGGTAYLAQLAGKKFSAAKYVFPARDDENPLATHEIELASPVTKSLDIRAMGNQVCWTISLYEASSVTPVKSFVIDTRTTEVTYDLTGRRVKNPGKGIYLRGGKLIIIK
ncbi:MAG: pectate lyase [Bacteroidales bacterium]|nr:pectate lyase [Bacteroidales bacterium]